MKKPSIKISKIDITNPINKPEIISALIESFVKVYGEDYRALITERITKTSYVFLPSLKEGDCSASVFAYEATKKIKDGLKSNPDIIDKIDPYAVSKRLEKIYPNLHATVQEIKWNRITEIVAFFFGEHQINNDRFRSYAEFLSWLLKDPGFGIHSTYSLEECILREMCTYPKREEMQECLSLLGIRLDCLALPQYIHDKPVKFSREQLVAAKQISEIIFNSNIVSTLQEVEEERIVALAEQDPFILSTIREHPFVMEEDEPTESGEAKEEDEYDDFLTYCGRFVYCYDCAIAGFYWPFIIDNELKDIIVCPDSTNLDALILIHEINHAISSGIIQDGKIYKTGFKIGNKFRELDEICNEYITQKVLAEFEKMEQDNPNLQIGFVKDLSSAYDVGIPFFRHFIEDNWDFILKSRTSVDPQFALSNLIGEDGQELLGKVAELLLNNESYFWNTDQMCEYSYGNLMNSRIKIPNSMQECKDLIVQIIWDASNSNKDKVVRALMGIMTYLSKKLKKAVKQKFGIQASDYNSHDYNDYISYKSNGDNGFKDGFGM